MKKIALILLVVCGACGTDDELSSTDQESTVSCGGVLTCFTNVYDALAYDYTQDFCTGSYAAGIPGAHKYDIDIVPLGEGTYSGDLCDVGGAGASEHCRDVCGDLGNGMGGGFSSACRWYTNPNDRTTYTGRCTTNYQP